jgi:diguanylate cyclase (GGDEF)-like protein
VNNDDPEPAGPLALVWNAMSEGAIAVDAQGRVQDLNPAAEQLTGWPLGRARNQPCEQVFHLAGFADPTDTGKAQAHPLRECLRLRRELRAVQPAILLPAGAGHRLTVRWRVLPNPDGALLLFEDITHKTLLSQELAFRTQHDALTGLLNREEFEHRLHAALADARANGRRYQVCCMDLDQFRLVNDTAGQFAGDEMLRDAAAQLRARLRDSDMLARLGGDKFGLLLLDTDAAGTQALLESLLEAIRSLRFQWDDNAYSLSMSVGAATLDGRAEDVASVMREADGACQTAKAEGRDRIHYASGPAADRSMMGRFTEALRQNRFVLFAEDVVEIRPPGRVLYREILVRWRDEGGRLIMPSAFVKAAERYFLITAMDRWVLQASLKHLASRPDDGVIHAVNLSAQSLGDDKFLDYVVSQLVQTGVAPGRLCLEITETAAISRLTEAVRFMQRLTEVGVRFSLDDFGTGMASFSYLKNLPVHFIKIDGSFVHSILDNPTDRGMVEAINRIGHEMGLRTIAESVESVATLEQLRNIGVDMAQGRAIAAGRPLEAV